MNFVMERRHIHNENHNAQADEPKATLH